MKFIRGISIAKLRISNREKIKLKIVKKIK